MHAMAFDGITRELDELATRRGLFRLLGGAALGAGLVLGGESVAGGKSKGRGGNHAQAQGQTSAEGRNTRGKSTKVTICHQNQTRQVKKKGWRLKYPGATLGRCPAPPQPAVCTSWILSGGPDPGDRILVDDDLIIDHYIQGSGPFELFHERDKKASSLPAIAFKAQVGDTLRVGAYDAQTSCRSLSPLWLHCATTGQKRQIFAGNNDGCAPGRTASYFVMEFIEVSL
jgi:hypothetical protein